MRVWAARSPGTELGMGSEKASGLGVLASPRPLAVRAALGCVCPAASHPASPPPGALPLFQKLLLLSRRGPAKPTSAQRMAQSKVRLRATCWRRLGVCASPPLLPFFPRRRPCACASLGCRTGLLYSSEDRWRVVAERKTRVARVAEVQVAERGRSGTGHGSRHGGGGCVLVPPARRWSPSSHAPPLNLSGWIVDLKRTPA